MNIVTTFHYLIIEDVVNFIYKKQNTDERF